MIEDSHQLLRDGCPLAEGKTNFFRGPRTGLNVLDDLCRIAQCDCEFLLRQNAT